MLDDILEGLFNWLLLIAIVAGGYWLIIHLPITVIIGH